MFTTNTDAQSLQNTYHSVIESLLETYQLERDHNTSTSTVFKRHGLSVYIEDNKVLLKLSCNLLDNPVHKAVLGETIEQMRKRYHQEKEGLQVSDLAKLDARINAELDAKAAVYFGIVSQWVELKPIFTYSFDRILYCFDVTELDAGLLAHISTLIDLKGIQPRPCFKKIINW